MAQDIQTPPADAAKENKTKRKVTYTPVRTVSGSELREMAGDGSGVLENEWNDPSVRTFTEDGFKGVYPLQPPEKYHTDEELEEAMPTGNAAGIGAGMVFSDGAIPPSVARELYKNETSRAGNTSERYARMKEERAWRDNEAKYAVDSAIADGFKPDGTSMRNIQEKYVASYYYTAKGRDRYNKIKEETNRLKEYLTPYIEQETAGNPLYQKAVADYRAGKISMEQLAETQEMLRRESPSYKKAAEWSMEQNRQYAREASDYFSPYIEKEMVPFMEQGLDKSISDFRSLQEERPDEFTGVADNLLNKAEKLRDAARNGGFLTGMGDTASDWNFWSLGIADLYRAKNIREIADKADKALREGADVEFTPEELNTLQAYAIYQQALNLYSEKVPLSYTMGQVTAEMIPFAASIALGQGLARLTTKGISAVAKKAATQEVAQAVSQALGKSKLLNSRFAQGFRQGAGFGGETTGAAGVAGNMLGGMTRGTGEALTVGAPRTWAEKNERMTGQADIDVTDSGQPLITGFSGRESSGEAFAHALAGNAIEYQSERAGQLMDRLGGALKARLPKDLQLSMGSLGDYIKSITPKSLKRFYKSPYYKAFRDNIQLQGVWSEYGEEELANWERVLLGLDEPDVLLDNEQRVETFLSLLPAQLMMGAGAGIYSAGRYRQASARLDKLMKEMKASDPELYEKYGKVRGEMDGFDVEAVTGLLSSIDRDGKLNAGQKTEVKRAALAEYYTKMLKSAQEAEIFGRADEEMKQAYEQAEALKERGSGNIVTADYEGRKVNITDDTGSDTVVIEYVEEDGKRVKRQVPRSAVGNAATVPVADVVNSKADEITARVKAEMQDLEHPGLPAPEPGTRLVHNGENHVVTSISPDGVVIMREDEEGNYSLPEVISTDTYYAEKQAEIDAQEQEQQPQSGERGEAAQETASPAEEEPAPVTGGGAVQEETAPGRMPKDEQGQPLYEQADAETAWDALLEQAGGDEAMAQEVANDIVSEQEKALKAAERELKKVQDGKPQQRKGDAPLTVEARIAAKQAVREQTSRAQAGVDEARKRLEAWRKIAETPQRRRRAIEAERRQEEEEAARLRGIQEEQERAEREEAERIRREALNGVPDFIEDRPQDARARGYRRVNGNRVDRQQPIQVRRGGEVQVKFDDNNIPTGHAALIEASQLQPSHTDGRRNPQHFIDEAQPKERNDEAQPKERNDEASVMSARKIAANIRPEEITSSVTAYTGAPTVNSRGEVIQGNNRSAALREMWAEHPEQAAKYRQYLADHAADFGLTPEDVEAMQQPVLVNMLDVTDDAAITLGQFVAQDTESGGTERIKPKNMVRKMGDDMRGFANRLLASADEEMSFAELVDLNGADVLKWMQQKGYITPTQYKSAFDSKGNLTAEAKNDLKGVMYQSIFQNGSSHLEEMFNALPAKAQKAILATAYRDYDSPNTERMIEEIQNSISAYHALSQDPAFAGAGNYKEARIAAEAWKRQYAFDDATGESYLPSERYSNFALLLATMYKGQTQKFIQNTLGHIYDLVQGTQEADLFNQPDNTPRTLVQAINETLGNLREELLLNENFTYNGQRRSNVLAGGSASGQRGQQGSDGNAPSGGRAENGARTDDGSGRTGISDNERGRQGNFTDIAGRQQDSLEASEGEVRLSDEIDENGRQFVLTSNGQLSFGEITEESGLTPAPILLSEGIITNPATNDGYGLVHIEARHGDQIRKAGYKSVIEFIEDVAQNYERVKEGNIRNGNPTYLIQLKDKHNNTLIVELSSDGNYWNINTAGIFKESYGKNRREIYNRHTTAKQSAETVGASQEAEQSGTTTSSSMNAPTSNIVSETPVKTEPQQPNNAVSTGSSLSENEEDGITSSEPNGKPTVSESKDKKTSGKRQEADRKKRGRKQIEKAMGMLREGLASGDFGTVRRALGMYWTNQYHGAEITEEEAAFVDGVLDSYRQQGIEIINPLGTRYDEGMKVVADFRTDDTLKPGENRIVGVREPQVNTDGVMSHSASITVAISPVVEVQGNADENIRRAESEVERNPSEAQKEAGNYRKGHVRVDGLDVTIENPKGSVRSGTDADGKRWENVMNNTYGYMRGTEGVDGDHIDVFLSDNPESGNVYVVDQRDPKTGEFDEHKVMYGFGSMEEARDAYLKNYEPGWQGLGTITEVSKDEFRKWIGSSKRKTKPFAEYKSVKKEAGQNEDVRQSRDVSNPLSAEEAAIRNVIVERLRESGIEVITDVEAGQRVLDEANGRGEPVRTQAMLDGLTKAADFIAESVKGGKRNQRITIELPTSTIKKIRRVLGRDFDSHNITANSIVHAKKNHGVNGGKITGNSIPLRDEDFSLAPYIMTAPDVVEKGSMDAAGRESIRFKKNLSNGYVVVVEKEQKNSPDDMETITMWAELSSSNVSDARTEARPLNSTSQPANESKKTNARTVIISSDDSAKIRKDAEEAIRGDEKVREHRVYHGSGADFEAFDHSHMGEGEGAQAYGWGSYVTEVEGIGRTYAKASTENKRENATVYKRRQIRDNEISINVIRGMIAEYPEQHREREKRLSDLEKELADQNSQKGRIEKESGKDSVAYRNFMFYAEDIIKDLERNIERTKRSIEDEAGYNEQRKRQVEELVAENARLQSEIDAIEAQYPRHLYTVEIPDDTGKNYLEWDKPVTKEQQGKIYKQLRDEKMTIKGASQSFWNGKSSEWQSGQKLIDFLIENLGSDKAASDFLSRAGFTGISYPAQYTTGGREDGARNYVIFDEKDLQITDHVRFFRTPGGEAYGFTVGGKIYIDPRTATADTPIHEYAHLWAGALRQANPKEWNNIVELMRDTPAWDEVKRLYPELESDEEIADEALAMYSGRRGAERLREAARRAWDGSADLGAKAAAARAMGRVRDALKRFWKGVADFLHIHYTSAEEVADKVMSDLLEGVNPNSRAELSAEERAIEEQAKKDGTWMKAPNGKPTNLTEKQWVQVRTRAFKQWFGDWEKAARIEKLRKSQPIIVSGNDYQGKYELNSKSAEDYIVKSLRGEYVNKDTGNTVNITRASRKVAHHDAEHDVHLKSIAYIPQMIENAIFIDEVHNEKGTKFDSYRYYVVGLKMDGVDYTAKLVVGRKNGESYYDHALTEIEKNSLLNLTDGVKADVSDKEAAVSAVKDKRLLSLLQTNSSKVVDENGEPLVVYHGSDYRPLNGNGILIPNNGAMGKAVYFSSAFPEAADYAREKLGDMSLSEDEVYDNGYITEVFVNVRDEEDIAPSSYGNGEIIVAVRESNQIKSATDNTGAFSAGNDDIRYRMAEEDKSLVAVHNTSEENLKKALELGGFPMPSIAITKADVGHTAFGEISLVFGKDSINPTDRRNKVYGEDAWTPTFPTVGYKLNEKKTSEIYGRANRAGSLPLLNPVHFHPDNYESSIGWGNLIDRFRDDYGAKQLFLFENGKPVEKFERHEADKYLPGQTALYEKMLDRIGLERLKGERNEALEDEVKRLIGEHYNVDFFAMSPIRVKTRISSAIRNAVDYAENGNKKTENDIEATKKKIDRRVDKKKFEEWLHSMFDGIVEKRGIRNDKDPFTASGNRRRWEQLYDEITLDNVVEAMRRQAARGGQGLFGGSIFGAAQEEYKDIDSVRKAAKRRIRMMSHEEAEAGRKAITDRLSAIEIPGVGERLSDVMDMVQNIQDAVARSHTAKGIYKYLKAFYPKVTMETANEIADIVKDIQAMSARYFEAKPYRAVGFDEVRLAVVPSDTDAGLVEQLKRKGIPVREYERGNEAERMAIVEEATDEMELRFREAEEEDANRRFNEELRRYDSGEMDTNEMFHLGMPQGVMRAFLPDLPIVMRQRVAKKGAEKKHNVPTSALQDMPSMISDPIFVFQRDANTIGILTDMTDNDGKNVCVAIELGRVIQNGGEYLEVNDIRSFHGREVKYIIEPIAHNNTLRYANKEKGLAWLSSASQPVQQEIDKQDLIDATNIVKDFENPSLEDENLFRIGETKRIGGDSLFGRRITFTRANPTVTLNAMKRWVLKNADLKEYDVSRTGSRYLSFTHNGVDYKIRSANHTKAYDGNRPENSGLSVSVEDRIYGVEIDLAENEMVKEDILRIIEDTDRLNDTGLNLQNTVESGLLPDEMVSADRELTDAVIREVREMAEWRLDSARTNAENEYEREHPLEDYKADNGIMILNRYFYGRVSYEVKFPDGWRGKTKQPRADAIQEYEDSDAHRRNMEQASGMNVYVDGMTKAKAETLRKIDGLAGRLEQERKAGAVREMAERLHLDNVEVVTDASTLTGRRARAKGFYSPRTGKIVIVIPNHASEADAMQTLLHEAVAHKGLRQLFGEHFDTFLWNVYRNADRDVRKRINALASEKGWDFPTATEEYLASLAENTDFENAQRSGWWEKIKRLFIDMLEKIGLDGFGGVTLSDNELRYILWRSYENLREPGAERSITGVAADVVKQAELKVGNYAEDATGGDMAAERGKKEASETDSVLEREHQHTVISDATGTKILNNLDNLVKRYENSAQSEIKTFIGEVAKAIGARRHGSKSEYATFETKNGKIITIRLSDHNASTRNFDNAGRNNGISIVITARKNNGVANDGNAHVVEFYYDAIKLRKTAGKPLAQIVRSIQQSLYSGEYHDTTGLAVREEVNNDEDSLLFRDGSAEEDGQRKRGFMADMRLAWENLGRLMNPTKGNDLITEASRQAAAIKPDDAQRKKKLRRLNAAVNLAIASTKMHESYVDKAVSLRPLLAAVEGWTGKPLADEFNIYLHYDKYTSLHQAGVKEFYENEYADFMEAVSAVMETKGCKVEDVWNYMFLKHGLERNSVMAKRDADREFRKGETEKSPQELYEDNRKKEYSGVRAVLESMGMNTEDMTLQEVEKEAEKHVKDFEVGVTGNTIDNLWDKTRRATSFAIEREYRAGILSRQQRDDILNMYQYYIPLRGWADPKAEELFSYDSSLDSGYSVPEKQSKGRKSVADSPAAYIAAAAQTAIIRSVRNEMKKQIYYLAELTKGSGLMSVGNVWEVQDATGDWSIQTAQITDDMTAEQADAETARFEKEMGVLARQGKARLQGEDMEIAGGRKLSKEQLREHQVYVKINGRTKIVTVNTDNSVAKAINNSFSNIDNNRMMTGWMTFQRFMAGMMTQFNPEFIISNLLRDMTSAMTYGGPVNIGREVPAAVEDAVNYFIRKKKLTETDALFQEFIRGGGETGYVHLLELSKIDKDFRNEIRRLKGGAAYNILHKNVFAKYLDYVSRANKAVEVLTRYAAYRAARKEGKSMSRAIDDAKNITANFNRKGSQTMVTGYGAPLAVLTALSPILPRMYAFFNASIQGAYAFFRAAARNPLRVWPIVALSFAEGILQAFLGDGDDDEDKYQYINDYLKRSTISFVAGDKHSVSIPIAYELSAWHAIGHLLYETVNGDMDVPTFALESLSTVCSSFTPVAFDGIQRYYEDNEYHYMLSPFLPTNLTPIGELLENRDWLGSPIARKNMWNASQPEYRRVYERTGQFYVEASKWLNYVSGGNDVEKGAVNINPAQVEHFIEGYFSGTGRFYSRTAGVLYDLLTEGELRNASEMPVISRFVKPLNFNSIVNKQRSRLYDDMHAGADKAEWLDSYMKGESGEDAMTVSKRIGELLQDAEYLKYKRAKKVLEATKELEVLHETAENAGDKDVAEKIEERIKRMYDDYEEYADQIDGKSD